MNAARPGPGATRPASGTVAADFDVVDRWPRSPPRAASPAAQVALAWLLHRPGVTAPIVGATRLATSTTRWPRSSAR